MDTSVSREYRSMEEVLSVYFPQDIGFDQLPAEDLVEQNAKIAFRVIEAMRKELRNRPLKGSHA